ncbi:MAG: ParB N-terminal domain-containing protein [Candidatus Aminicenantes bacterium]|nr:ParB N-terminal domain-containing protein [Candidatus Aminicenantes bacterium]
MVYRLIKLSDLNLEDRRFRFTLNPVDQRLLRSVGAIGVLQPVIITARQDRQVLVDGWRRVEAARSCGLEELPALEIAENIGDLAVLLVAFFENYAKRPFSLAEKSLAIRKFYDFRLGADEIIERFLPLLELPPERRMLELMLEVSLLGERFLEVIHRRDWKPVTVELLLGFPEAERAWLLSLIEKLTRNQQREIIENFYLLKRKTGKCLEDLAREEKLAGLTGRLLKGEISAADRLLAALREENSPLLSGLHRAIEAEVRTLGLPPKVRLDYDRALEETILRISLEAGEVTDLKEALQSLSETLEKKEWRRLFQLLHYEGE